MSTPEITNMCSCTKPIGEDPTKGWVHVPDDGAIHLIEPSLDPNTTYNVVLGPDMDVITTGVTAATGAAQLAQARAEHVPPWTDADIALTPEA